MKIQYQFEFILNFDLNGKCLLACVGVINLKNDFKIKSNCKVADITLDWIK